ncbi:hypothetical protein D3C78_740340 [compost metagenome]
MTVAAVLIRTAELTYDSICACTLTYRIYTEANISRRFIHIINCDRKRLLDPPAICICYANPNRGGSRQRLIVKALIAAQLVANYRKA